jgi:hypothetical protein
MKAYAAVEVYLHVLLTTVLDACERLASCPTSFTSSGRAPGTYCMRGWVKPTASLDAVENITFLPPTKN